jgi:hypothetical protein
LPLVLAIAGAWGRIAAALDLVTRILL